MTERDPNAAMGELDDLPQAQMEEMRPQQVNVQVQVDPQAEQQDLQQREGPEGQVLQQPVIDAEQDDGQLQEIGIQVEPQVVQPQVVQPQVAQPQVAQLQVAQPQGVQPQRETRGLWPLPQVGGVLWATTRILYGQMVQRPINVMAAIYRRLPTFFPPVPGRKKRRGATPFVPPALDIPVEPTFACPQCRRTFGDILRSGERIMASTCSHTICHRCMRELLRLMRPRCPVCDSRLHRRRFHRLHV